ncbi:MAG: 50S ribosomal protein L10 [Paludibacteraceae bacterium]|nr:50S ribosomal protein L10 [Paludibacteraceae bacterium]MBO7635160.1 50S ribosomal protein L10 [Paludibacteraceae bacterium]MBR5971877.1 50S ribosomal protein L10 [Paludibacteraceae bacterium]
MKKEDKSVIIDQILAGLNDYSHFYIADAAGLTADLTSDIRRACFKKDIKLVVVKNTLLKKALDKKDGDFSQLYSALEGPTALMLSNTGNAPAKLIKEFSKGNKLGKPTLKAAYVEEGFYVGADQLDVLASIKSKNELIGDIIALLQSPMRNIISGLQAKAEKEAESND